MKMNMVLGTLTILCTFVASDKVRDSRQAGRYGQNYGGNQSPNYGPNPGSRPNSQSVIPGLGHGPRPSQQQAGYSFVGPSGRPASGPVFGVSGVRPGQSGGPRPGSAPVYRGQPVSQPGRPGNSYKG